MEFINLDVWFPQKDVKFNHSLTLTCMETECQQILDEIMAWRLF